METLYSLLTIPEVARAWGKHQNTVRMAMGARYKPLEFRKSDRVYLITYASCVRRWGQPRAPVFPLSNT